MTLRYNFLAVPVPQPPFWGDRVAGGFLFGDNVAHIIDAQPYFGIALTPECDLQAYVEVKSRTTTFEVRTGEFEPQPVSVYLTVRKYWGLSQSSTLLETQGLLFDLADDLAANRVVPLVVSPLALAIAGRS